MKNLFFFFFLPLFFFGGGEGGAMKKKYLGAETYMISTSTRDVVFSGLALYNHENFSSFIFFLTEII